MLGRSVTAFPQHPKGVRFVDHEPRVVAGFDVDEAWQVRVVPVHAVETLNNNQRALERTTFCRQHPIEAIEIIMRKRKTCRTRQHAAHDDAVMREGVINDEVFWSEDLTDYAK